MLRVAGLFLSISMLSACGSQPFQIVDNDGTQMFEMYQGACVVGCNVILERPDGTKCSGFAPALTQGTAAQVQVSCPGEPKMILTTEKLSRPSPNAGSLKAASPLMQSNSAAVNSALAHEKDD